MNHLVQGIERFIGEEEGVTMVEYGLIAALIAIVCALSIQTLGSSLNTVFKNIGTCLASPSAANCPTGA